MGRILYEYLKISYSTYSTSLTYLFHYTRIRTLISAHHFLYFGVRSFSVYFRYVIKRHTCIFTFRMMSSLLGCQLPQCFTCVLSLDFERGLLFCECSGYKPGTHYTSGFVSCYKSWSYLHRFCSCHFFYSIWYVCFLSTFQYIVLLIYFNCL